MNRNNTATGRFLLLAIDRSSLYQTMTVRLSLILVVWKVGGMCVQPHHTQCPKPLDLLGGGDEYSREGLRDLHSSRTTPRRDQRFHERTARPTAPLRTNGVLDYDQGSLRSMWDRLLEHLSHSSQWSHPWVTPLGHTPADFDIGFGIIAG